MFCLPTNCRYIQTILFGTVLQEKVGAIYDHPTTQHEQFIERYYGRLKGSGKSKATVISDGQVRGVMLWGDGGGGGFQLNITMSLFWKNSLEMPPNAYGRA